MEVKPFSISRIHTDVGIFRLQGQLHFGPQPRITFTAAGIMSTDGWQALNITCAIVEQQLTKIQLPVLAHLGIDNLDNN